MSLRLRVAFVCHAIVALGATGVGVVYLTAGRVMPYHQQVLGVAWEDIAPQTQLLLVALLRGGGAAALGSGLALLLLLWFPFRRGERWAYFAVPAVAAVPIGATTWIAWNLATVTGASTPWPGLLALFGLLVLGFLLSLKREST